ncbi:MAG: ABC transporter substrate-binding protein [Candidatus Bathyarchaeia archaeon]
MERRSITKVQAMILLAMAVGSLIAFLAMRPNPPQERESERYVEDILGRKVRLPKTINRVAAVGPGVLRIICYLNATDLIVGVEEIESRWGSIGRDYAMAHGDRFKDLPVIGPGGPGKPPAPELILAAKPDLIIVSRIYAEMYDPDRLQKETGSAVMVMDYGPAGFLDLEQFFSELRILGSLLNRRERAEYLIDFVKRIREDLETRTKGVKSKPKVYVGSVSYKGAQPFTTTQVDFPPLKLLSTPSIADSYSNKPGPFFMDFEAIIQEQPDVIFIDEGNLKIVKQEFDKDPDKYYRLKAFKIGNVYGILPYNYYHTNVAVALADAYYMGKVLYPDRFGDVDPELKADEIFMAFLGKPLYRQYKEAYGGFVNLSGIFQR